MKKQNSLKRLSAVLTLSRCFAYNNLALNTAAMAEDNNNIQDVEKLSAAIPPDFDKFSLEQILEGLKDSFSEGFKIKINDNNAYYNEGKVSFRIKKCSSETEQIVINLQHKGIILEELYFSQIKYVQPVVLKNNETPIPHIIVGYYKSAIGDSAFPDIKLVYYDFTPKNKAEIVAGYMAGLAKFYSNICENSALEKIIEVKEVIVEKPVIVEKEVVKEVAIPPINLTTAQKNAVCSGSADIERYEIKKLGRIDYEECIYEHEENKNEQGGLVRDIETYIKDNQLYGLLLLCGNTTKLTAKKCPFPTNEGNFLLSFYRAENLADYFMMQEDSPLKNIVLIPHPYSTKLDEQSANVYFVKNKKNPVQDSAVVKKE